jgi:hypothetical protein
MARYGGGYNFAKVGVEGSNPFARSNKNKRLLEAAREQGNLGKQ